MAKKKANEDAWRTLYAAPRDNVEQSKLKIALLKENFEYREWFDHFLEWQAGEGWKKEAWPGYMFKRFGLVGLRFFIGSPNWKAVLDLINPGNDTIESPHLTRIFYDHAVTSIEVGNESNHEGGWRQPIWVVNEKGLRPGERLFKIDLKKKKTQIKKEFSEYLDRAYMTRTAESNWTPDNSRDRKEAWRHLAVWKLRRKRKSFSDIAKELEITKDAAKKNFYRAFELICGNRFDPVLFKRDYWEIRQGDIGKQCRSCPNHPDYGGDCNELCPDMLAYVDQDERYQREKLGEKNDAILVIDKKSKTKTGVKKKTVSLNKATLCPGCQTVIPEALKSGDSIICPFCYKKIST